MNRFALMLLVMFSCITLVSCDFFGDNGLPCCCVPTSGAPYWTHTDFCGGSSVGCQTGPLATNECGPRAENGMVVSVALIASMESASNPSPFSILSGSSTSLIEARALAENTTESSAGEVSCLQKCPVGKTTADCLSAKIEPTDSASLQKLVKILSTPDRTLIKSGEMMALFHLSSDPCSRHQTLVSASGVSNDGRACAVTAPAGTQKFKLSVYVPAHLEGVWETRTGASLRLRFGGSEQPALSFIKLDGSGKQPLDDEFGGKIEWAEADAKQLMVRTSTRGCVGVPF